jgi:hypothetical protein
MTTGESLRPQDRSAMAAAIRRTAGWAALGQIPGFIAEEEGAERRLRKFVLPVVAISLSLLGLVVLTHL